ncbi:hypothetical protein [Thermoproteus tenax]|uniref:Uncharacterized protein n=1 Tax=Thermoproteus tenax (strain ATCC 35583 / DSM 2078 / JCM 9277 / NBRC 100435 / Kra 1) TaxID=768679 RepID=G4RJZ8_THETK|nr:hypothetical protein [Thermoproteus tenax]CCC81893.1 hypothetical protein TTX_1258 [Thermoproteus tenax Kra 1]
MAGDEPHVLDFSVELDQELAASPEGLSVEGELERGTEGTARKLALYVARLLRPEPGPAEPFEERTGGYVISPGGAYDEVVGLKLSPEEAGRGVEAIYGVLHRAYTAWDAPLHIDLSEVSLYEPVRLRFVERILARRRRGVTVFESNYVDDVLIALKRGVPAYFVYKTEGGASLLRISSPSDLAELPPEAEQALKSMGLSPDLLTGRVKQLASILYEG